MTNAMRDFLREEFGIEDAVVVKDKAADRFRKSRGRRGTARVLDARATGGGAQSVAGGARERCVRSISQVTHACMTKNKPRFAEEFSAP